MKTMLKFMLFSLLLAWLAPMAGCGCGFDCNSDDSDDPAVLTLGMSDSLPEDLKEVVIEVDSITLRRSNGTEEKIDTFTIDTLDLEDEPTFQIDLLQYRGVEQLEVVSGLQIPRGTYNEVWLEIIDGSVNNSYVKLQNDSLWEITLEDEDGILELPGIVLSSGRQQFVIEFGLAQALKFRTSSNDYLLSNTGVRIEDIAEAATVSGEVDSSLFNSVAPCNQKSDPQTGNRIYLYKGVDLVASNLADVYTSASTQTVPTGAIAPFAVASLVEEVDGSWEYSFGYVPAGDYTMAFACDTADDDSVNFDDLVIPLPSNRLWELDLLEGEDVVCDLEASGDC